MLQISVHSSALISLLFLLDELEPTSLFISASQVNGRMAAFRQHLFIDSLVLPPTHTFVFWRRQYRGGRVRRQQRHTRRADGWTDGHGGASKIKVFL